MLKSDHTRQGGVTPLDAIVAFASRHRLRGAARLRRLLRGHHEVALTRVRSIDGLLFDLDVENVLDWAVLDHGYYEREVLDAVLAHLTADGVLWDVGANVGLHAITAKRLRPAATVVAFEPSPHTAARLVANADLNGADLRIVTCALAETNGLAQLSVVTRGNSGLSSLRPWPDVTYEATITCPCARADALIGTANGALPRPTVIKLDVEGFEAEVLRGFGVMLADPTLRAVVFEASGDEALRPERSPVGALLAEAGMAIQRLPPAHASEKSVATNFLATRDARA